MTRWLRTSKIPIIIAAVVLIAILAIMFFRLTDPAAGAVPLPAAVSLRLPPFGTLMWSALTGPGLPPIGC